MDRLVSLIAALLSISSFTLCMELPQQETTHKAAQLHYKQPKSLKAQALLKLARGTLTREQIRQLSNQDYKDLYQVLTFICTADGNLTQALFNSIKTRYNILESWRCLSRASKHVAVLSQKSFDDLRNRAPSLDAITLLIECGADIHAPDRFNRTALLYAITYRDLLLVELLLKQGSIINIADTNILVATLLIKSEDPAEWFGCSQVNTELIACLVKAGCDLNIGYQNPSDIPVILQILKDVDASLKAARNVTSTLNAEHAQHLDQDVQDIEKAFEKLALDKNASIAGDQYS